MISSQTYSHFQKWFYRLLPLLMFLFGFWYFSLRILGVDLAYIPGDLGDSRFINYILEHGYQWMSGTVNDFWNAPFMHPYPNVIAISDNMLGTMPIYSFFRSIGFQRETAYQLWWLMICALNYWSAYFVSKKWTKRNEIAVLVAFIFAFSIFNLGQMEYMQMIIRFMVPITIYNAAKLVETGSLKNFLFLLIGLVYQFYSVIYTGFFLFYFTLGFIILYALITKRYLFFKPLFQKSKVFYTLGITVTSIFLLVILFLPYWNISDVTGFKLFDEVKWTLPTWKSYLLPSPVSVPWHFLTMSFYSALDNWWVHISFPGMIPLLTIIAQPFLWIYWKVKKRTPSKLLLTLSITTFLVFLFFLRTENGLSLYALIFKLPGMNSMRVLNRFIHVGLFFALIALAFGILNRSKKWVLLLLLLAIIDNSFRASGVRRTEKSEIVQRRIQTAGMIKNFIRKDQTSFVILPGENQKVLEIHLDAMITSQMIGVPTINAYTSSSPVEYGEFFQFATEPALENWLNLNNIDPSTVFVLKYQ